MTYNAFGGTLNLALSVCIWCRDFNEIWQKYSSCECALLWRFSRSEIKCQGYSATKCTFAAEACDEAYLSRSDL